MKNKITLAVALMIFGTVSTGFITSCNKEVIIPDKNPDNDQDENLFPNNNEYGLTYIDFNEVDRMLFNPMNYDNGNFIIVYGNEDCGACRVLYSQIKIFRESQNEQSKKYKFYNIDTKATPDKNANFWTEWIDGQDKLGFNRQSSKVEKFTSSVSMPVSILIKDGNINARASFSGSANATDIDTEIKKNYM